MTDGLLLLDKSADMSSNHAVQHVKRLFEANKVGHTGTLDPFATGLLPICINQATKFSHYLLDSTKHYQATACLGYQSTTGDPEGELTECLGATAPSQQALEAVLAKFRGESLQVPPMYSALKHEGRRLYDYARKGIIVEREPRPIIIHRLELTEFTSSHFSIEVECSKGTYIRTLVESIGHELGTVA